MKFEKGYSAKIDNQYTIHIAKDTEEELKAILRLNLTVHQDELLEPYIRRIFLEHPRKKEILWFYVKDNYENKLISSICLLPLEWQVEDIRFPVCEMEFVGTLESYRGQNFIKKLNILYEKVMAQKGYLLSVIRGIPYYYRSLGYEYVSSLDERISIPASKIPKSEYNNIKIRKATANDISFIQSRYNQSYKKYYIFNIFDPNCFKFKYMNDQFNAELRSTYIIEENGELKNYFSIGLTYDHENYEIICPDLTKEQMIMVLQFIEIIGNYSEDEIITLSISEVSLLHSYVKSLGGSPLSVYGWQVKIPNLKSFFQTIRKIIEKRLERSEFKEITKILRFSDYNETVELNFVNGKIQKIEQVQGYPNPQVTDLRIPGAILFKLLLGDRTVNEINYIITDAIVHISSKLLIDTIFPKQISFFSSTI
jgi:predicted acetyltransferase